MAGIDLIPASYRQALAARRIVASSAIALGALLLAFALAAGLLQWQLHTEKTWLDNYRIQASKLAELQRRVEQLSSRKLQLEQQAAALAGLRGAGELMRGARAIDRALNSGVWLTSLRYRRHRQALEAKDETLGTRSAHTVVRQAGGQKNEAWSLHGSIQLQGAALDYAALSRFMQALAAQPGIADARFINSSVSRGPDGQTIEFSASASILPLAGGM